MSVAEVPPGPAQAALLSRLLSDTGLLARGTIGWVWDSRSRERPKSARPVTRSRRIRRRAVEKQCWW